MSFFPPLDQLRAKAQPPEVIARANAEHWAGRLYLRHMSIYLTRMLIPTGISANGVTWLMAIIGVLGASVLGFGFWWVPLVCALMMQIQVLVDCSDGEVARWRGTSSAAGIYIDRVGHYLTEALLPIGFGVYVDGGFHSVGRHTMIGMTLAILVLLNKAFGDLVHIARANYGLPSLRDDGEASKPNPKGLRAIRRILRFAPFFRAFVAIEFSLIVLAVSAVDILGSFDGSFQRAAITFMVPLALIILFGRIAAILTSDRLKV